MNWTLKGDKNVAPQRRERRAFQAEGSTCHRLRGTKDIALQKNEVKEAGKAVTEESQARV